MMDDALTMEVVETDEQFVTDDADVGFQEDTSVNLGNHLTGGEA